MLSDSRNEPFFTKYFFHLKHTYTSIVLYYNTRLLNGPVYFRNLCFVLMQFGELSSIFFCVDYFCSKLSRFGKNAFEDNLNQSVVNLNQNCINNSMATLIGRSVPSVRSVVGQCQQNNISAEKMFVHLFNKLLHL